MPSPQEFEIRPVRTPALRAARTAPIIVSSGLSPAKSRSTRPSVSETPSSAPNRGSNSSTSSSPVSSRRRSASASVSSRNRSRTSSPSRPSDSQNALNAGQTLVVNTPPKSTTSALVPIWFPAMAEQATRGAEDAGGPDTSQARGDDGIDAEALDAWFVENVAGAQPPLGFERISGGRSNRTYRVSDSAGGRWALRRPPLGKRLTSAHDMGREHRIVSALRDTEVPVAPVVGFCADESVNGAPFYVMDYVEGPVLRTQQEAEEQFSESERG